MIVFLNFKCNFYGINVLWNVAHL